MGGGEPRRRARYRSHDGPEADARRPRPATRAGGGGGSGSAEEESATVVPEAALPELSQHASAAGPVGVLGRRSWSRSEQRSPRDSPLKIRGGQGLHRRRSVLN